MICKRSCWPSCPTESTWSLSELSSINSAGINALVAVHTHCTSMGGQLALFAMTEEVRKLFKVTKLDKKMVLAGNAIYGDDIQKLRQQLICQPLSSGSSRTNMPENDEPIVARITRKTPT